MFEQESVHSTGRRAAGPLLLLVVAAIAAGVLWAQPATPAEAAEEPYYHYYAGSASVKIKTGNAFNTTTINTCAVVETQGENGAVIDAYLLGFDPNGVFADLPCEFNLCNEFCLESASPSAALSTSSVEMVAVNTSVNEAATGTGWRANPTKQTSTQWTFTMKTPDMYAGAMIINDDIRAFQPSTALVTKFVRGREGLYFKLSGTAPTGNGPQKTSFEIESRGLGLDAAPRVISSTPGEGGEAEADGSIVLKFSEPVTLDTGGLELECTDPVISWKHFDVTVSGQGTDTLTITPTEEFSPGAGCDFDLNHDAVSDVDTNDPPEFMLLGFELDFSVRAEY